MYIVTSKDNNRCVYSGERLGYSNNGFPILLDENVAFPTDRFDVFEVEEIPAEVEMVKYCYTPEQGFYVNPDWKEPATEELYTLDEAAAIIASEVAGNE